MPDAERPREPPDHDLVARLRLGDEDAFAQLYERYGEGLYHVTYRVLSNSEDAGDAVQEALITAFRRISTYRGEGSFRAWLYRVATRISLRMRSRRRPTVSLDDELAPPVEAAVEPVRETDFRAALEAEIQRLPERARIVFTLHTVEELTHVEIGEILGINEGTSKSQLSYARSLLRRRLDRWYRELT